MGYGIVDNQVSNNSCADKISNIMALNIGASMSPMDKLTVGADIWYAMLAEDEVVNGSKEDYLGTELDLSASYEVMDNLTLDVVAAYLFAGDATGDEDPMQLATQLSFSF
jgi:outer membrane protein W